jgi:modulator of FtsH protease
MADVKTVARPSGQAIEINRVLRNTYLLLGMTLAFSAGVAYVAMISGAPYLGFFPTLIGFFGLSFLVHRLANSAWGLLAVFLFTGFLGYTLGPLLALYLKMPHGPALVGQALALTAGAFVGLSGYALVTRRDFNFLSGFLVTGAFVLLGAMVLAYVVDISGLALAVSAGFVLFACALILFETSSVIHGGETNYIRATVGLYVSIYNLFTSLLYLLGIGGDE